jgi:putative aldouronate transport system substrate-binding protein
MNIPVEKNKTYTVVDGKHQFTEFITNNPDGLSYDIARRKYTLADMTGAWDWDLEEPQYSLPEQKKASEVWKVADTSGVMPAAMTMTQDEGRRFSTIMAEVETYIEEKFIKFVMGIEQLDKFDEFVAQVESMNIEEAINIQQAALDRYIAR